MVLVVILYSVFCCIAVRSHIPCNIRVLDSFRPRQLRILFLLKPWHAVTNFSKEDMSDVRAKEKALSEFFILVSNIQRTSNMMAESQHHDERDGACVRDLLWSARHLFALSCAGVGVAHSIFAYSSSSVCAAAFLRQIQEAERRVDAALKDNFDTPATMNHLITLVRDGNVCAEDTGWVRSLVLLFWHFALASI